MTVCHISKQRGLKKIITGYYDFSYEIRVYKGSMSQALKLLENYTHLYS